MRSSWRQRWSVIVDAWRARLWPLPVAGIAGAVVLGVLLPQLDVRLGLSRSHDVGGYLFGGGPEAARTVLSVVAGSLITVTSLTFSLTVVTLQLASSQFSPRLLRTFTRDGVVQTSLALLLGTFTYAVTVLRTVRTGTAEQSAFVPQLSVTVAYLLGLASVIGLVVFLAHLVRQIRVEWMLREVHTETRSAMLRLLPDEPASGATIPATPPSAVHLTSSSSGFLTSVDEQNLLAAVIDAGAAVILDRLPGDSVVAGTPIAMAWSIDSESPLNPDVRAELERRLATSVRTGFERTPAQDVAFGLRQLTDVAVKALSPGINDPTTAIHALGHSSALLCEAAQRDLGPRLLRDDDDRVRVVLRRPDLGDLLELVIAQPRRYGAADPDVLARLLALLRELAWTVQRPGHHHAITSQLDRVMHTVQQQDFDRTEHDHLHQLAAGVRQALAGQWPGRVHQHGLTDQPASPE